jgi:endonuclease/exonuclease/phosphatase (EEP) superfamily protein YafD
MRWLGWLAVLTSLLLHAVVVFCFADGRDALSAVAVFPIWLWAIAGCLMAAIAMLLLRSRWPIALIGLWALSAAIGADERRSLIRGLTASLEESRAEAPTDGSRSIRVATLNCGGRNVEALKEVARFNPDIVFLQEAPSSVALRALAKEMFGAEGSAAGAWNCAIIARGKLTPRRSILYQHGTGARLELADGTALELMSIHLAHATTRWDLWSKPCWREHRDTHRERRNQLRQLLANFETAAGERPRIFGGDFNSPPSSNLFEAIPEGYTNTFGAAGRGLGNTFINRLPVLRIDHIYAGPRFEAIDSRAVRTAHSDHRMVISDLTLPAGP